MFSRISLFLVAISLLVSCTKTMDLPALPNNRILSYKVTNILNHSISGVIDEEEKTITVYIPFYHNLGVIDPILTLSEGAVLQEDVLPVLMTDTSVTYTVIGSNKSKATYRLKIVLQQPDFTIEEVSASETTQATFNVRGTINSITGNFSTKDLSVLQPYLVSVTTGNEFPLSIVSSTRIIDGVYTETGLARYTISGTGIPFSMDTGFYRIGVRIYNKKAETKFPVRLNYPPGSMTMIYDKTFKQGQAFTLLPGTGIFRNIQSFEIKVNDTYVSIPIQSYTRTEAVVTLPENFPPGFYTETRLRFEDAPEVVITYNYFFVESK